MDRCTLQFVGIIYKLHWRWLLLCLISCSALGQLPPKDSTVIWTVGRPRFPFISESVTIVQTDNVAELLKRNRQGEKITALSLNLESLTIRELSQLKQLPYVRSLTVNLEPDTPLDSLFMVLADLPKLEVLGLTTFRGVLIGETEKPLLKIPASIQQLAQLREIRLSDFDFDLEVAIAQLAEIPGLRVLELTNPFSQKPFIAATMGRLSQLTHLRLSRGLTYLPTSLGELANLKHLTIVNQMPSDSGLVQVLPRLTGLERLEITFADKGTSNFQIMMTDVGLRAQERSTAPGSPPSVPRFPALSGLKQLRRLKLAGRFNRMEFPGDIFDGLDQLDTLELTEFKPTSPLNAICALRGLRYLNLSHNQLAELPAFIGQLKQLEVLRAEYDSLKTLPESLTALSRLTHLSLTANQLQTLPATIGYLTALHELKISDNELQTLPASLGQLKQLETLEIKTNQLTMLPDVGQLQKLRTLNVFDNQLQALPPSLCQLTKLRTLVVLGNQLTELPTDIGNLKLLNTLLIDQNRLTSLPESIGKLDSLQRLLIGENLLRQLPDGLLKLRHLRELYIGKNLLTSLPAAIGALQNLESVTIADNPLTELPESVGAWTKLKTISIQYTKIRLLPTSIGKWSSVTAINVDNNELMALPREIGQCRQLKRLSVRNASLLGLPESIGRLQQLKELIITGKTDELHGNRAIGEMQKLPDSLAFCRQLTSLRINHQNELDTWSLYHLLPTLPSLRELDLTDCGITDLSGVPWPKLSLQRLVLAKNKLAQLPINLASSATINWIDLSENPLPPTFNQPFSDMNQLRVRLVDQAIATGTLPDKFPDKQLMQAFLSLSRQRMEQHYLAEYVLSDIDKAERFASDSLQSLTEGQRADVYRQQKDYASAIAHYERAIDKATLLPDELVENTFFNSITIKTRYQLVSWWGNKGICYGELGQYNQALSAIQKGLSLLSEQEAKATTGPMLLAQGRFLALTQKNKEAQSCFARALAAFQVQNTQIQQSMFTPRRFIRQLSGNSMTFFDPETLKRQLTIAALGLVTGNPTITERELARMSSTYSASEIGIYGLVLNYLQACAAVVDGRKTPVQATAELQKIAGDRSLVAENWSFAWLEAALPTMIVSAEKKEALRQLTAIAKARLKE